MKPEEIMLAAVANELCQTGLSPVEAVREVKQFIRNHVELAGMLVAVRFPAMSGMLAVSRLLQADETLVIREMERQEVQS